MDCVTQCTQLRHNGHTNMHMGTVQEQCKHVEGSRRNSGTVPRRRLSLRPESRTLHPVVLLSLISMNASLCEGLATQMIRRCRTTQMQMAMRTPQTTRKHPLPNSQGLLSPWVCRRMECKIVGAGAVQAAWERGRG